MANSFDICYISRLRRLKGSTVKYGNMAAVGVERLTVNWLSRNRGQKKKQKQKRKSTKSTIPILHVSSKIPR